MKLFVRPEHTLLTAKAGSENLVPVTEGAVSFEGAFIWVLTQSDSGKTIVAEIRNNASATVAAIGAKTVAGFDAAGAALLPMSMCGARAMGNMTRRHGSARCCVPLPGGSSWSSRGR